MDMCLLVCLLHIVWIEPFIIPRIKRHGEVALVCNAIKQNTCPCIFTYQLFILFLNVRVNWDFLRFYAIEIKLYYKKNKYTHKITPVISFEFTE